MNVKEFKCKNSFDEILSFDLGLLKGTTTRQTKVNFAHIIKTHFMRKKLRG
jgi:hypothetical protein